MRRVPVPAKINLALLVGGVRADGLHEVVTVLQRIDLCDRLTVEEAAELRVEGFAQDTLVRDALAKLQEAAGVEHAWHARLDKRIPVAAGLGGGSADAAAALLLANATLAQPFESEDLTELAAELGADVPFFVRPGPKLAEGAGERLTDLVLPQDFWVVIVLASNAEKDATGTIYDRFDERGRSTGFDGRRAELVGALARVRRPRDFERFPANDLAEAAGTAWLSQELRSAGAFRADVSGAGPAVYGLFHRRAEAARAARLCRRHGRTWVVAPVW
ncbi:MAG: 4-(cytidine 5'-diphospho)-2-C-methyl-D-erythritol kinase [Gaiellaceae bacterium]